VRYIIDIVSRIKEARSELSRAILAPRKWPQVPRLAVRRFVRGDHPLVGRWRRRRGGRVDLAGCVFDLDVPQVSDGIFSRFVLGRYEKPEIMAVGEHLPRDLPLLELGAGLGVVSCIANKHLEHPEQHWVIEANPELLDVIEKQRALNAAGFSVLHGALSYEDPAKIYINRARVTATSAQRTRGELVEVPAVTLSDLVQRYGITECSMMIDIEGAELDLVEREGDILARYVEFFIMEVHPDVYGEAGVDKLRERCKRLGFSVRAYVPPVLVMQRSASNTN